MLGQPVYFLTPDVVGVNLTGAISEGVTATDVALTVTQLLRKTKVVGKFVEFFGVARRRCAGGCATIANMAPEYGATMGFFQLTRSVSIISRHGRSEPLPTLRKLLQGAGSVGHSANRPDRILASGGTRFKQRQAERRRAEASPRRIELGNLRREFFNAVQRPVTENGFGKTRQAIGKSVKVETAAKKKANVGTGSVLIAAITSCTNTSNPSVMLARACSQRRRS